MKSYEELKEENARLTAAIEWELEWLKLRLYPSRFKELRTRAFPPQEEEFEEVEVKRYLFIPMDGTDPFVDKEVWERDAEKCEIVELTGTRRIPKPRTVTRRVEVKLMSEENKHFYLSSKAFANNAKLFAEWTEVVK